MTRAYLRLDPGFFERKAIVQGYQPAAAMALVGCFCLAESQPERGRFRNERVLKALLADYSKWIPYLKKRGDLVEQPDGRLYIEGWDEWQEGDWKVGERVKRIRTRRKEEAEVTPPVTPDVTVATVTDETVHTESTGTNGTVYNLSDGGRPAKHGGAGRGIAGHGGISSKENPSRAERVDVQALLDHGWHRVTPAQRRVLDEILGRHDRTGPDWAARIIAATPGAEDPLAAVVAADREWQAERRPDVLAAELEWDATKLEERREAKGALTHIRDVLG